MIDILATTAAENVGVSVVVVGTLGIVARGLVKWLNQRKNIKLNLLSLSTGDSAKDEVENANRVVQGDPYDVRRCLEIHAAVNKRMDLSDENQRNLRQDIYTNHSETNDNFKAVFRTLSDIRDRLPKT
jgi:hypothetical protein